MPDDDTLSHQLQRRVTTTESLTVNINTEALKITVSYGSAYTVVQSKGDAASQWEMTILGCQNSATHEPID